MATAKKSDARERLLRAATELFYTQGYRATGVNEIIASAGVAKATFFAHFPTKEALAVAYLERLHEEEAGALLRQVEAGTSPRERFLAVIRWIEPWIEGNELRGCGFLNMVPEVPDANNPLRHQARAHYEVLRDVLRGLADDLLATSPSLAKRFDAAALADRALVVLLGSIALSEIAADSWPARVGAEAVESWLDAV